MHLCDDNDSGMMPRIVAITALNNLSGNRKIGSERDNGRTNEEE